jgi:hypothetical protein
MPLYQQHIVQFYSKYFEEALINYKINCMSKMMSEIPVDSCFNNNIAIKWNDPFNAWVAHFDILGFTNSIENSDPKKFSSHPKALQRKIELVLCYLKNTIILYKKLPYDYVNYLFYADTFIIYSKTDDIKEYFGICNIAKLFFEKCIEEELPIRGAISFGEITTGYDNKIVMGKAFIESKKYSDDQNWLGLILTPSAAIKIKEHFDPKRHKFVNRDIPLRKYSIFDENIYAYTTIKSPNLIVKLKKMKTEAPKDVQLKYENTICFIERYGMHAK